MCMMTYGAQPGGGVTIAGCTLRRHVNNSTRKLPLAQPASSPCNPSPHHTHTPACPEAVCQSAGQRCRASCRTGSLRIAPATLRGPRRGRIRSEGQTREGDCLATHCGADALHRLTTLPPAHLVDIVHRDSRSDVLVLDEAGGVTRSPHQLDHAETLQRGGTGRGAEKAGRWV